ncbi:MAG: hypothetical protein Q4Q03_07300 [Bowdeniella nasicola]|nr:hypothetical protein [Bowdeniella nasicola]
MAFSRPISALLAGLLTTTLAACGTDATTAGGNANREPQPYAEVNELSEPVSVSGEIDARTNDVATAAFTSAKVAVVADPANPLAASCGASLAKALHLPALASGDSLAKTLADLQVETVMVVPQTKLDADIDAQVWQVQSLDEVNDTFANVALQTAPTVKTVALDQLMSLGDDEVFTCPWPTEPDADVKTVKLAEGTLAEVGDQSAVALLDDEDILAAGSLAASGIHAYDAETWMDDEDASKAVAAGDPLVIVSADAGAAATLQWQAQVRANGHELPGGGYEIFKNKRYVALYGSPVGPSLGVLGEQGVEETVARATSQAAAYNELSDDTIVPALEIIATVASGSAGDDGNYSNEWDPTTFVPLIDAATQAGQYVILDFQPGRADFLSQVRQYESLLKRPNVGIALDPEWRLGPDEIPLQRIGHVEIDEVNAVIDYLAEFTAEHELPQKMVILHQFQIQMLRDRDQVRTGHPQIALLIHADGQGTQGQKQETWQALLKDAPAGVVWGWKNFIDEDEPMLNESQTFQIEPQPHFVSYQ